MPFVTSSKTKPAYDVIIVGSGAAGGQSAYVLTAAGARVLMLEAGRNYDPISETPMFNPPLQAPLRGAGTPDKPFGFYDATVNGGWTVPKEPYMVKNSQRGQGWYEANNTDIWSTGQNFMWWRPRMLGGRTNHWARFSFRMGPYDFKPKSRDGLGLDWPITYEDMAPYYDKVEALIGVLWHQRRSGKHARLVAGNSPAAAQAARQRTTGKKILRQTRHSRHSVARGGSEPTAGCH